MPPTSLARSASRTVRRTGLALLLVGWISAALVAFAARAPEVEESVDAREADAIARIGGTATVRAVRFDQWLGSLWHGERLAWTLATFSVVAFGACFYMAGLMDEAVETEDDDDRDDDRDAARP